MEVVNHDLGGWQHPVQRGRVALVRIDRCGLNGVTPPVGSGRDPSLHCHCRAILDDIEQPTSVEIDERGHPRGRPGEAAAQEVVLVQPERDDPIEAVVVGEQLFAQLEHRGHDGVPPDPELAGDLRHTQSVTPDLADRPRPRSFGQHRPRPDRRTRLPPRPAVALRLLATPDPLLPHQQGRTTADRDVTHPGPGTALRHRPRSTGAAEVAIGSGLDQEHELVPVGGRGEQTEPVEPEKQARQGGNVIHACGLRSGVLDTAILVRPQALSKHLSPRYHVTRPPRSTRRAQQADPDRGASEGGGVRRS